MVKRDLLRRGIGFMLANHGISLKMAFHVQPVLGGSGDLGPSHAAGGLSGPEAAPGRSGHSSKGHTGVAA